METEIEPSPEVPLKEGESFFLEEKEYGNNTGSSNFQNDLGWMATDHHESVMDFLDVSIKEDDYTEQDDDLQSALVCTQSSFEQASNFQNAFPSYSTSGPEEQYESTHNNENLQDTHNLMNLSTKHGDWLDHICESTAFDSGIASGEIPCAEYSGEFTGCDHIKGGTDSEIATCYPDFSDMCSDTYSFWEFLPTHNSSPNESREKLRCYYTPTPNSTINCNPSMTPSSGYYSEYSEISNEKRNTDVNMIVPYSPELFPQKTTESPSSFSAPNQAKTENQTILPVSVTDCSQWTESTVSQSSSAQQCIFDNSVPKYSHKTAVRPGRPLPISDKKNIVGMLKNLTEESDESPLCVLESVYSLHNDSHLSFGQSSGTSGDHSNKESTDGNSTKSTVPQGKESEISKDALPKATSFSSSPSEPIKSGKSQNILLLLKGRIPRSTLNNKVYASAKLLVQNQTSQPQATKNTSTLSNSSRWNVGNNKDGVSRSKLQKSLPMSIPSSFRDCQSLECPKSNADGSCFDVSTSDEVNFNQSREVSHKLIVADRGNSHEKNVSFLQWAPSQTPVTQIPSPQISVFAISPVQQHFTVQSKGLTENNDKTLPYPITVSNVSLHSSKTVVPDSIFSISPVQLHNSSQPKNLTGNKNEALACSTATSSVHVDKSTAPKLFRTLNTPPPYIAVVKKSVVNSSKRQRQKTVRELLAEKQRKLMLETLARQTIKNSGQLNSPVKFVTPLNEVSNNRTVDSKRRPVAQSSTYTFNCNKQDCGKHFVRILPAPAIANENRPLTDVQITASTLLPASYQDTSKVVSRPSASCSVLKSVATTSALSKQATQGAMAVFKEKTQDTLPPFKAGRVNAKEHRPRHYDIIYLQIGNFYVSGQESSSGRMMSKFKIIFTKRHFTYEFPIPDSCLTYDSLHSVACIVVAFESITAMMCDNNVIKIQVNCQPVTYLGSHQPRFGIISSANVFDTSTPVDITKGEIMKSRVHEIQLRGHQADVVKKYLWNFDKRFKVITQRSIRPSASGDVGLLPSAYVCRDSLPFRKARRKGISGYVRKPPWPCEVPTVPSQVCACRISCRSVRCSCVKAGQKCSQGRSICLCSNCDNPLNVLHSMGIDTEMAVLDSCLFHNVYQVPHLRQFLTREVILSCCQSVRPIKDCIPGVVACPNSTCGESIQYSWCINACCVIRENPPKHCAGCGKCRFNNMRHCEECNRCYSTAGNLQCPKCKPE